MDIIIFETSKNILVHIIKQKGYLYKNEKYGKPTYFDAHLKNIILSTMYVTI